MCIIPPSQNQKKFRWSLVAFKGTIRKNPFRGEHYHEKRDLKYKKYQQFLTLRCHAHRGLAESNFSNFVFEYLGEIETEFANTLSCLSWVRIMEKNRGGKSRDTLHCLQFQRCILKLKILCSDSEAYNVEFSSLQCSVLLF